MTDQWELAFAQPASDYIGMKARLERDNVCLENVIIKEAEGNITGTVKVRVVVVVVALIVVVLVVVGVELAVFYIPFIFFVTIVSSSLLSYHFSTFSTFLHFFTIVIWVQVKLNVYLASNCILSQCSEL